MNETRLSKRIDAKSYLDVINLYKEVKTNPNFTREDFIIFKSFLVRMINAQEEKDAHWSTPHLYFKKMRNVHKNNVYLIKFLLGLIKYQGIRPFDFDLKKHYGCLI